MLLQRDSENSKTSEGQYRTMSPPEYQTLHRYMDSMKKIVQHYPRDLGECECGFMFDDHMGWAEHLTGFLFKKP